MAGLDSCALHQHLDRVQSIWTEYRRRPPYGILLIVGGGGGVSIGTRPQEPGGGEAHLMATRDVATAWPVVQPTSQPVLVRLEAVEVSAVSVDATLRRRDRILSTISDSVMMVTEEFRMIGLVRE